MNSRLLAVMASALALLGGCSDTPVVKAKTEILAADRAFNDKSVKDGPRAAYAAYLASDGKILSESAQGAEGIKTLFDQLPDTAKLTWECSFVDADPAGDMGYTWGHYTLTIPLPKYGAKPLTRTGTYVTIWRRQVSGAWKVVLDGGSPDKVK
jgi:ketosteroid isomerase-like protein